MIDSAFVSFAERNLVALDEVTELYCKFQQQNCEEYWQGLQNFLRSNLPEECRFAPDPRFWKRPDVVRCCGWSCPWRGQSVRVGLGVNLLVDQLLRGNWPFSGTGNAWTGISFDKNLPTGRQTELYRSALGRFADAQYEPNNWVWREFRSLTQVGASTLYEEITIGSQGSYEKILADLKSWMEVLTSPSRGRIC